MRVTVGDHEALQEFAGLFMDEARYRRCVEAQLTLRGIAIERFETPLRIVPETGDVERAWEWRPWFSKQWKPGRPWWWEG